MKKAFNLNDKVYFRLTEYGLNILKSYYEEIKAIHKFAEIKNATEETELSLQLHEFVNIFGEYTTNGAKNVIVDNVMSVDVKVDKTYAFHTNSGHIGGSGVVVSDSKSKALEVANNYIEADWFGGSRKPFEPIDESKLIEVEECVILSNGDY